MDTGKQAGAARHRGADASRGSRHWDPSDTLAVAAVLAVAALLIVAAWAGVTALSPCATPDVPFAPSSPAPSSCQDVSTHGARWGLAMALTMIVAGAAACLVGWMAIRERYAAALAATGMSVPPVAAVLMSAAYLGPWFPWLHAHAVVMGSLASLSCWFIIELPLSQFATAERASPRTYGDLKVRVDRLGALLDNVRAKAGADLAVALIATPQRDPAAPGVVYTVALRNLGPSEAGNVAVALRITGDATVADPRHPRDEWSRVIVTCDPVRSIEYRCRRLAAGTVVTFREEACVGASGPGAQPLAAEVEVSSESLDANPRNDVAEPLLTPLPVVAAAETGLRLEVFGAPDEVAPGGALTYAVVLANDSTKAADDLRLAVDLPPSAALARAAADVDGWSFSGNSAQLASLAPGAVSVLRLTVAVDADTAPGTDLVLSFRLAASSDGFRPGQVRTARCTVAAVAGGSLTRSQEAALCVARRHYEQASRSLTRPPENVGWRWIMASGYVTAWNQVHRAEEALLEVLPIHEVVGEAFQFGLRLRDSNVGSANDLLDILRRTLTVLSPAAATSLVPGQMPSPAPVDPPEGAARVAEARTVIRQVVRTVNEFRDSSRDGLLRARVQLMRDVAFAGLTTYVLMCIAVVLGVSSDGLLSALVYYFVGAVVGLFNRLYLDSSADTAIEEDYGLSIVRLIETPLFSGLAALGGVLVTAMLPLALNGGIVTPRSSPPAAVVASATPPATVAFTATPSAVVASAPTATPAPAATPGPGQAAPAQPPSLSDVFSLQRYPFGIVMAAIFGLTPTLLISRLSQPVEKYKSDLKSTEASQH